ncbi:unnamed protein product [Rhodiola kirilowii]
MEHHSQPKPLWPFVVTIGSVCCSSKDDQQLQKQFKAMNPSDAGCASVLKSILCAEIY